MELLLRTCSAHPLACMLNTLALCNLNLNFEHCCAATVCVEKQRMVYIIIRLTYSLWCLAELRSLGKHMDYGFAVRSGWLAADSVATQQNDSASESHQTFKHPLDVNAECIYWTFVCLFACLLICFAKLVWSTKHQLRVIILMSTLCFSPKAIFARRNTSLCFTNVAPIFRGGYVHLTSRRRGDCFIRLV